MEVDILIDTITECLIDTRTGEEVETEYRARETPIRPKDCRGGFPSKLAAGSQMWRLLRRRRTITAIQEDIGVSAHICLRSPVR